MTEGKIIREGGELVLKETEEEIRNRKTFLQDVELFKNFKNKLTCTKCSATQIKAIKQNKLTLHPTLRVIYCKSCLDFYTDGDFSVDEDGDDKYCRWCGEGGNLMLCARCNCGFCKKCVKKNLGNEYYKKAEKDDNWKCLLCYSKPLWSLRHIAYLASNNGAEVSEDGAKVEKSPPNSGSKSNRLKRKRSPVKESDPLTLEDKTTSPVSKENDTKQDDLKASLEATKKSLKKLWILNKTCQKTSGRILKKIPGVKDAGSYLKLQEEMKALRVLVQEMQNAIPVKDLAGKESIDEVRNSDDNLVDIDSREANQLPDYNSDASTIVDSPKADLMDEENEGRNKSAKVRRISKNEITSELPSSAPLRSKENTDDDLGNEMEIVPEDSINDSSNTGRKSEECSSNTITKSKVGLVNSESSDESSCEVREKSKDKDGRGSKEQDCDNDSDDGEPKLNVVPESPDGRIDNSDSEMSKERNDENTTSNSKEEDDNNCDSSNESKEKKKTKNKRCASDLDEIKSSGESDDDSNGENKSCRKEEKKTEQSSNNCDESGENTQNTSSSGPNDKEGCPSDKPETDCDEENDRDGSDSKNEGKESEAEREKNKFNKEIDALVNLKTLDSSRRKTSSMGISSSVKSKKEGKKKSLFDMLKDSSDESDVGLSEDSDNIEIFKELQEEIPFIKDLILGSESCEEISDKSDDDNKKEVPKTRKKIFDDSDSSEDEVKEVKRKKKRYTLISSDEEFKIEKKSDSSDSEEIAELPKETKKKRKRVVSVSSGSSDDSYEKKKQTKPIRKKKCFESEDESGGSAKEEGQTPKGRKNIRKLMKKAALPVETKAAVKDEEERKARVAKRDKRFSELFDENPKRLILDFNDDGEILLEVSPRLVKKLKPHQREGVKFLWDNCFESLDAMETSNGSGCILAHCMGLGKTLQVVTLLHTVLTHSIGVKTALIICPMGTVSNWKKEFEMWFKVAKSEDEIDIYDITSHKEVATRNFQIKTWLEDGGILVLSYDMFRNLTKKPKGKAEIPLINPGPDIVVCDEGHLLKNEASILSKCVSKIQTARRIVLTGTPLQNNLREYHCMVQFIKPNILGNNKQFMNRFVNPIENGQFEDSTEYDVRLMKRRSHVLHNMLEGCIQRKDYKVLVQFLPEKMEFVLAIALTPILSKLYRHYLDNLARSANRGTLFNDFQALQRIWTHPIAMRAHFENYLEAKDKRDEEESEKEFIDDGSEDEKSSRSGSGSGSDSGSEISAPAPRRLRSNPLQVEDEPVVEKEKPWWQEMVDEEMFKDEKISGKLFVLFSILDECAALGDKVLVFSQSLYSLNVIEHFLELKNEAGERWEFGINYFRLDGSMASQQRDKWCKHFNMESNTAAKLFLISTRAGGLGINLVAANRVILFDASWNPSHDLQSIFRVYRFGQKKTCYIYRLLAEATMEEKIYERQVTKLSLAGRVVDEHQIERHYTMGNLQSLYSFEPLPKEQWKTPLVPKDTLLAKILKKHEDLIVSYHEHDSLLENKQEEELTEEERKSAWEEFENVQANPQPDTNAENIQLYQEMLKQAMMKNPMFQNSQTQQQQQQPPLQSGNIWNYNMQQLFQLGQMLNVRPENDETIESYKKRLISAARSGYGNTNYPAVVQLD